MVGGICYAETADVFPGITARNRAVLEYEKFVHRTFYPHIIHPYSRFRVYWEVVFLILIPLRLISVTMLWVFINRKEPAYIIILTIFQLINLTDVILRFFTGYVDSKTEIVVLDPKKIISNYLLKFFILEAIPCIPINLIAYYHPECYRGLSSNLCIMLNVIDLLIILRSIPFFLYLYHTSNLFLWYPFLLGLICTPVLVLLFFLLLVNALYSYLFLALSEPDFGSIEKNWFTGDNMQDDISIIDRFKIWIAVIILLVDYLNNSAFRKVSDLIIRFTFLLFTFFCSILFMVYCIKFVLLKMKKSEKFLDLESRILSFAKKRRLSSSLRQKILLYFLILLENKYCKEDEIFHYIPNTFKAEIFFHLCLPLLKNFYAFEDLPTYVLRRLAECMKYQLYLPNELVMTKNEPTLSMYFIQRGTVALYSSSHVELYHFEAGSSINGRNFIMGDMSTSHYAISIEVTEVYRLDYVDYMDIMAAYPKLLKNIVRKFQSDRTESTLFADYSSSWY